MNKQLQEEIDRIIDADDAGTIDLTESEHAHLVDWLWKGSSHAAAKERGVNQSVVVRALGRARAKYAAAVPRGFKEPLTIVAEPIEPAATTQSEFKKSIPPSTPVRDFVARPAGRGRLMRAESPSAMCATPAPNHLVLPDSQVKPGVPLVHFKWIAKYAAQKRPTRIVDLGDRFDLPSLSSYDKGTRRAEGKRLSHDIAAGVMSMRIFEETLAAEAPDYEPDKHMLDGNHEHRLSRHIDASPELDGVLSLESLRREEFGWKTHEFLKPLDLDGVRYCHYFVRNTHGAVVQSKRGQPSAREQVKREGVSCIAGHKQSLDVHYQGYQDRILTGIIAGSCYLHDEEYLTPQGDCYWRGILMLLNVTGGEFGHWAITLDYLCRRFEGVSLREFLADATPTQLMIADV